MAATLETVLLWWGRDLYIYHGGNITHRALGERAEVNGAVVSALDNLPQKPKRVRLIYQPGDVESTVNRCPKASRPKLRKMLADDVKPLENSAAMWALLDPRPLAEGGFITVVSVEKTPRLATLDRALAGKGIRLTGAWSLPSLVDAYLAKKATGPSSLAVLHVTNHVLVFSQITTSGLDLAMHDGPDARNLSVGPIRQSCQMMGETSVDLSQLSAFQIGYEDEWPLDQELPGTPITRPGLADLLNFANTLRDTDGTNFFAGDSAVSPKAMLQFAGVTMFLAAGALFYIGVQARIIERSETRRLYSIRDNLKREVATLVRNRELALELNATLAESNTVSLGRGELLESISKSCPPSLTLNLLRVTEQGFVISGVATDGIGQKSGPFFTLVDSLTRPKTKQWTIPPESRPDVLSSAEFTLSGRFTTPAPLYKAAPVAN